MRGDLAVWLAIVLTPYWLGPIVVWLTQKWSTHPVFEPFDPARHPGAADIDLAFRQTRDALVALGFAVRAELFHEAQGKRLSTRVALLEHPATGELALAAAIYSAARPVRLVATYVELPTKFEDGRTVSVHNSPRVGVFAPRPPRTVVQFPQVRDPARLCRIKRAFLERHYGMPARVPFAHQDDPVRFLSEAMARELAEQVEVGTWRRDDRAGVFRPTFAGAWLMTWKLLPPFNTIRKARLRRRAARILEELALAGPDPRPIAQPATRFSFAWFLLLAGAAWLAIHFGRRALETLAPLWRVERVTLPAGFAVPGDFPGAVRALERLAGARAAPLEGVDSLGSETATGGFAVPVHGRRAAGLVAAAQPLFRGQGFYLFRSEQNFGIQGEPDRVALFPRGDPYEILRLVGTNGWNYGIGPDSIVAWLRALAGDQPFVITGMGFDWLEGRFTGELRDPDALARRLYEFCPDIVEQGTGTVRALADDLRRSKTLYCWWD